MANRSAGVVLMAPPDDSPEARASIATLLSALKPKQKVRSFVGTLCMLCWQLQVAGPA